MFSQNRSFNTGLASQNNTKPTTAMSNNAANDDQDIGRDDWNPRKEVFEGFLKRDLVLAGFNVERVLREADKPLLFREIKECLIHSTDTIERALVSKVASGTVREEKGRYSLINL